MLSRLSLPAVALACACAFTRPAAAHVTLDLAEAKIGGSLRLAFRVPHGCSGSATVTLRVRIPDGVIAVKPMPKPGWQLETVTGPYDKAYPYFHGATLREGVREVVWSGGKLPDAFYDEFVISGSIANGLTPDALLYFPVVQECETGVTRWIEIPKEGQSAADLKEPAPALKLRAGSASSHH